MKLSDTARWTALARAIETGRPDALFQDPFAARFSGATAGEIGSVDADMAMISRSIAVRTRVIDELILAKVREDGVNVVLSLGSGLDTRAWRLDLPVDLRWVEVDRPEVQSLKADVVGASPPRCSVEAVCADVANPEELKGVLERIDRTHGSPAQRVLVVTEGLLVYLPCRQVRQIARQLHGQGMIEWWITDTAGPRALEFLQRIWGPKLTDARFQFAPADSAEFFASVGWREVTFLSSQTEAKRLRRDTPAPLLGRLILWLGSPRSREEMRRLSGCAVLRRLDALEPAGG